MWRRSFSSVAGKEKRKWDAVVVGAGHNGLTAAAYLARSGLSVLVLERRHVIGGAAVTEEIVPGFRFSRCSYLQSLLRPTVIRELELHKHGLKLLKRNPSSFTPCLDGRYLLLGPDDSLNSSEISKFSRKDAAAYTRYEEQLKRFCGFMDLFLDSSTPEIMHETRSLSDQLGDKLHRSLFWIRCLKRAFSMGHKDMLDFVDLLVSPASRVLNNWFETDVLKATLATDAVIGTMVAEVMVDKDSGIVNGVRLVDGREIESSIVLSNATPYLTFTKLVPPSILPEDFLRAVKNTDYNSGTTKINIALDRLPQFACCQSVSTEVGPQHMGTIHIGAESMEEIHVACRDAWNGFPSNRPLIEMTIPSVLDKTISPSGKHVVNLFIQYTPYKLSEGSWQDCSFRESFAKRCFSLIDEYAPGFSSSIIDYEMLTPPDLEREFGLTGGNVFHGSMGLDSLFLMRPVRGWSGYRTPLRGLYLCGSGTHPGGGVMGAPGRNAAHAVIKDLKSATT